MEFVPGSVVQGVQGNQLLLSEAAPSILTQMGALVALDWLLNNVARVPAIWLSDGNLSNVMVTRTTVVGIDQQVNPIGDEGGRARYLALLREFCDDSVHRRVASPASKRIRTALLENTGVEFNDRNFGALLDGAGAAFRKLAAEKEVLLQAIKGLEHSMHRTFGASSTDVGLGRVELIDGIYHRVFGVRNSARVRLRHQESTVRLIDCVKAITVVSSHMLYAIRRVASDASHGIPSDTHKTNHIGHSTSVHPSTSGFLFDPRCFLFMATKWGARAMTLEQHKTVRSV